MNKANIFFDNDQKYRNGYKNIDLSGKSTRPDIMSLSIEGFSAQFEDEEFDEIIVDNLLEYFDDKSQSIVFNAVHAKLFTGKSMYIRFTDINEVARKLHMEKIDEKDFSKIVFSGRKSISSLNSMKSMMGKKYAIQKISFEDIMCSIEGVRL